MISGKKAVENKILNKNQKKYTLKIKRRIKSTIKYNSDGWNLIN